MGSKRHVPTGLPERPAGRSPLCLLPARSLEEQHPQNAHGSRQINQLGKAAGAVRCHDTRPWQSPTRLQQSREVTARTGLRAGAGAQTAQPVPGGRAQLLLTTQEATAAQRTDGKAEVRRGQGICPKSRGWPVACSQSHSAHPACCPRGSPRVTITGERKWWEPLEATLHPRRAVCSLQREVQWASRGACYRIPTAPQQEKEQPPI